MSDKIAGSYFVAGNSGSKLATSGRGKRNERHKTRHERLKMLGKMLYQWLKCATSDQMRYQCLKTP